MGILDSLQITGIKPKIKPTNRGFQFQKDKPITPYNYPLSQKTKYKIYGYKKDFLGMKTPYWLTAEIATGKQLNPQMVGLDGFFSVEVVGQVGLVSPRRERKEAKKYSSIPEDLLEEDTFIYNENVINDRGNLHKNVSRTD